MLPRQTDPRANSAAYFGSQLREFRKAAQWTQLDLAAETGYHHTYISHVERGERVPDQEFVRTCDRALQTAGTLERIWPLIARDAHPSWFRDWVRLELQATGLRTYQITLIPGLLQTAGYARELLKSGQPGISDKRVSELVEARLERQAILDREDGPELWVVLDHSVLTRGIGGDAIMKAQLSRVAEAAEHPRITVQVIPPRTAAYPGLTGAFVLASFGQGPDALYLDTTLDGQVIHGGEEVDRASRLFEAIRSEALPVRESAGLVARLGDQWI